MQPVQDKQFVVVDNSDESTTQSPAEDRSRESVFRTPFLVSSQVGHVEPKGSTLPEADLHQASALGQGTAFAASGAVVRRPPLPLTQASQVIELQRWEGVVVSAPSAEREFGASIFDLTDENRPMESAVRAVSTSLRQPGSAFTVATPRHRRGATTTDRAAVAAGQRPHAASRPGCRSSVLGHPGGWFSTAD